MSRAAKALMDSKDVREAALAAYVYSLIDKSNPVGTGYSKRKLAKEGHIMRSDSPVVGQFEIDICDPGFGQMFVPRANR